MPDHTALPQVDCTYRTQAAEVCRAADSWQLVFEEVAEIAANPQLRATDILLVGDHAPPFWRRKSRGLIKPDRIPWILLKHRALPST